MFSLHYWFSEVEFTPSGYRKDIWGHVHFSFHCNHRVWHKMSTFKGQSAWWVANCHLRLLHIARGCVCEGLPIDLSIRMIGSWPCMFWQHHDYITRPILYKIYQIILRVMRCSNCLTMLHISKQQYFVSGLKTPHSFIEIRLYFFTLKTLTANHWIFIIITDQSFTVSGFFFTLLQRHILAGSMCQIRIDLGTWRSSDFSLILSLWKFWQDFATWSRGGLKFCSRLCLWSKSSNINKTPLVTFRFYWNLSQILSFCQISHHDSPP